MKTIEDLKAAYKVALSSKDGGYVMEDLSKRFHCFATTYVPDSNEAAFREGQRSVVLFIQNMLAEQPNREDIAENE
jgi:hypothetical protein